MDKETVQLRFNSDGKFRILQLADIQEIPLYSEDTDLFLRAALEKTKPDLVVLTGDQIKGYAPSFFLGNRRENFYKVINRLMKPIVDAGVPFAVTFGNHDSQVGVSKPEQLDFYKTFPGCVADNEDNLPGAATFHLPILSSKDDKVKFNIYVVDSHEDAVLGGYEPIDEKQIRWYRRIRDELAEQNGGKVVPSLVFQHVPVPEFYDALEKVEKRDDRAMKMYGIHKGEYYRLSEETVKNGGLFGEPPSTPDINSGEFEAMCERRDVIGIYVGHDHKNSFVIRYGGMDLGYTQCCGFNSYGPGVQRGVRVIDLNEENPREYTTEVLTYKDLVGNEVKNKFRGYFYEYAPDNVDAFIDGAKKAGIVAGAAAALYIAAKLLKK